MVLMKYLLGEKANNIIVCMYNSDNKIWQSHEWWGGGQGD